MKPVKLLTMPPWLLLLKHLSVNELILSAKTIEKQTKKNEKDERIIFTSFLFGSERLTERIFQVDTRITSYHNLMLTFTFYRDLCCVFANFAMRCCCMHVLLLTRCLYVPRHAQRILRISCLCYLHLFYLCQYLIEFDKELNKKDTFLFIISVVILTRFSLHANSSINKNVREKRLKVFRWD